MDAKRLPKALKKGLEQQRKKNRRDCCAKNRGWIGLGSVGVLVVLIVGLVWILSQLSSNRTARHTFKQLKECLSEMDISKDMTELVIPNERCNEELFVLDMGLFTKLQVLWIGASSFGSVRSVKVNGLKKLEHVVIGERSFTNSTGVLTIRDCNALKELRVEKESFKSYESIVLSGLLSLETLRIDGGNFRETRELKVSGLPGLKKIVVGDGCFSQGNGRWVLSQCSTLSEVTIGSGSFGKYSAFQLDGLPALEALRIGDDSFGSIEGWSLEQLNGLKQVSIGERSFSKGSGSFLVKKCEGLESITIGSHSFALYSSFELEGASVLKSVKAASNCFADGMTLKLDGLSGLEVFEVGDECFANVKELKLIGMNMLERVMIGENSFTKEKNNWGDDSERHFYLKNCPKVKELRVGRYSFSDYSVIEIENVDRLEVIEIGELSDASYNFYSASLRLRSMNGMMK